MTSLSEAHAHWHMQRNAGIIDPYACCPLDCAEDEARNQADYDEYEWEAGNVTCGHCKDRGRSVEHVRLCPSR